MRIKDTYPTSVLDYIDLDLINKWASGTYQGHHYTLLENSISGLLIDRNPLRGGIIQNRPPQQLTSEDQWSVTESPTLRNKHVTTKTWPGGGDGVRRTTTFLVYNLTEHRYQLLAHFVYDGHLPPS